MGRPMPDQPSVVSGALKLPFAEQVAFFRGKLGNLVPTARWDDLQRSAHDRGFMVAGAAKADLLADLAVAVDRTKAEGKSLEAFRQDFMATIQKHGWQGFTGDESAARRAWRTRVIYQTNAATSYAAGREAQLREGGFAFKVYHHADGVANPRPQHVAWDGLVLPVEHPFWATHSPPNGWGCGCYVTGASSHEAARRLGGDPAKTLPEGWDARDPKTGAPPGIDKGWDYAPGASVAAETRQMAEKTRHWPYELAKAYMQEVPNRDALARAYRGLPSVADDARRYAARILEGRTHLEIPPYRTLGLLTEADAARVQELTGKAVAGYDYAIDQYAPKHILNEHGDPKTEEPRGQRAITAGDYARLPRLLNEPERMWSDGDEVLVEQTYGEERQVAVFEVLGKRQMLNLKSMRVIARRPRAQRP